MYSQIHVFGIILSKQTQNMINTNIINSRISKLLTAYINKIQIFENEFFFLYYQPCPQYMFEFNLV